MTILYHVFSDEMPNPKHTEFRYSLDELKNKIVATNLKNYYVLSEDLRHFNLIEVVGQPEAIIRLHLEHLSDKVKAFKFDLEGLLNGTVRPEKIVGRGFNTITLRGAAKQYLEDSIAANESRLEAVLEAADKLDISPSIAHKCRVLSINANRNAEGGWTWNERLDTGRHILDPLRLTNRELLREVRRQGLLSEYHKGTVAIENDQQHLVIVKIHGRMPLYAVEYGPVYT